MNYALSPNSNRSRFPNFVTRAHRAQTTMLTVLQSSKLEVYAIRRLNGEIVFDLNRTKGMTVLLVEKRQ